MRLIKASCTGAELGIEGSIERIKETYIDRVLGTHGIIASRIQKKKNKRVKEKEKPLVGASE